MNIHQITFSPTGGTRRVSELLCQGFADNSSFTELCTKEDNLKYPIVAADDLAVISMPVYAGRVPALAVERLKGIKANGARCVILPSMAIGPTRMLWWKCKMWQEQWASM